MSSYLRNLLNDIPIEEKNKSGKRSIKPLAGWLSKVQSDRPVSFDTTQDYEIKGQNWRANRQRNMNMNIKCFECGAFGHTVKDCNKRRGKTTRGFTFKDTDWMCPSCGNINWDWRQHCNKCNSKKPDENDTKRTGKGGGYLEIDEETLKRMKDRRTKISKQRLEKQVNRNRFIYIQNMSDMTKLDDLFIHFKSIGKLDKQNIYMFANVDGSARGDALIEYDQATTAPYAKLHFDGKPFLEHMIKVNLATEQQKDLLKTVNLIDHQQRERDEIAALEEEIFAYRGGRKRGRGCNRGRGHGKKSEKMINKKSLENLNSQLEIRSGSPLSLKKNKKSSGSQSTKCYLKKNRERRRC